MHEPSAAVDMSGNDTRKSLVEDSFLTVKEGVLPSDLLEESYIFLQTLLDAVTAGKVWFEIHVQALCTLGRSSFGVLCHDSLPSIVARTKLKPQRNDIRFLEGEGFSLPLLASTFLRVDYAAISTSGNFSLAVT